MVLKQERMKNESKEQAFQHLKVCQDSCIEDEALTLGRELLLDVVTCNICTSIPLGVTSAHLCPNGHSICEKCLDRISGHVCPTCKVKYPPRPVPLDLTLLALVKALKYGMQCPNYGCKFRTGNEIELRRHSKKGCANKIIRKCPIGNCSFPLVGFMVKDMAAHFIEDHGLQKQSSGELSAIIRDPLFLINWVYDPICHLLFKNHLFPPFYPSNGFNLLTEESW